MADFGVYTALSGRKDWQSVRRDRLLESQFLKQQQQDLQARIDKEAQARAGVTEYMNQLSQTSVLEQDLERVKGVEEEKRKAIVEGLKKAGNDYNKFLMGNGASLLNSYREDVMKSEEMQGAINNKLVFAQSSLDNYLGRKARPVTVTLPDGTTKEVSMDEQWKMFDNGEITKVNYAGSVVPTDFNKIRAIAQTTYGDDRYTRQALTKDDIYNMAIQNGAEDWEAKQMAENYEGQVGQGAEPVYWKQDDPLKRTMMYAQLKAMNRKMEGGADNMRNMYIDASRGVWAVKGADVKGKTALVNGLLGGNQPFVVKQTPFANNQMKTDFMSMAGLKVEKGEDGERYYYPGKAYGGKSLTAIDITDGDIVDVQNLGTVEAEGLGAVPMLRVKVKWDSDKEAQASGAWNDRFGLWGKNIFSSMDMDKAVAAEEGNFKHEGGDVYGEVYIPVKLDAFNLAMNDPSATRRKDYEGLFMNEMSAFSEHLSGINTEIDELFSEE